MTAQLKEKYLQKSIINCAGHENTVWRVTDFFGNYDTDTLSVTLSGWKDLNAYKNKLSPADCVVVRIQGFSSMSNYPSFFADIATFVVSDSSSAFCNGTICELE